ncbi:hypothetical protein DE4585_02624 [Mycobacteroides salmoniphilum]|uniref:Uncharacterized protein n=1 Tax=Mycobacteroides salmoniphilum TaxID=404941 RepID=A0A4R8S0D0_9MYCO|nr:hypothetical protein DE4585_02624 [Mycobacteroides salmoniphilum]
MHRRPNVGATVGTIVAVRDASAITAILEAGTKAVDFATLIAKKLSR